MLTETDRQIAINALFLAVEGEEDDTEGDDVKPDDGNYTAGSFVVLSADESCFTRARQLWVNDRSWLRWVSDPLILEQMLATGKQVMEGGASLIDVRILGIVLDLTPPGCTTTSTGAWLAWHVGATLTAVRYGADVPLLLLACDHDLERILGRHRLFVVERIEPADSDARWEGALKRLSESGRRFGATHIAGASSRPTAFVHAGHIIRLSENISCDMARWVVLRGQDEMRLTAREAEVLAALVERPNTFRGAAELARRVSLPGKYPVDEHSIEQTICTLRRKLGESAKNARLVVGQRCLGYALMLSERAGGRVVCGSTLVATAASINL